VTVLILFSEAVDASLYTKLLVAHGRHSHVNRMIEGNRTTPKQPRNNPRKRGKKERKYHP
jgi:hypothetical protein